MSLPSIPPNGFQTDAACSFLQDTFPKLRWSPQLKITPRVFSERPEIRDLRPYMEAASLCAAYQDLKMGQSEANFTIFSLRPLNELPDVEGLPQGFWEKADVIRSRLLSLSQSSETPSRTKDTLLRVAACRRLSGLVQSLLGNHGVSADAKKDALDFAAEIDCMDIVELLMKQVSVQDQSSAIMFAAKHGHLDFLRQHNFSAHARDWATVHAAASGHLEIVQFLLADGHVLSSDEVKARAVACAAGGGHNDVVEFLLSKYVLTNKGKEEVILHAALGGRQDQVQAFLNICDLSNKARNSTIIAAAERGHRDIVQLLCEGYVLPENVKRTAMHSARQNQHEDVVSFLDHLGPHL